MGFLNLSSHSLVRVAGEGAEKLLNDTLSGTISRTMADEGRWFALLSPQGKVLSEGLVSFAQDAFWLDMSASAAPDFIRKMKLYRLRAKAEIEDVSDQFATLWSATNEAAEELVYRDARHPDLGFRTIVTQSAAPEQSDETPYHHARIGAGVAEIGPDFAPNEVFPHDLGMDFLGGVDFKKGCYIGQEVVSRMQHRGTARRRPVVVAGLPDGASAGAPVEVDEREAGVLGTPVGGMAVGLLRLDRIRDAGGASVGGLPVKLNLPAWANYRFGGGD